MTKEQMLQLLKKDVVPALGCTEPVCVALCAAHAAGLLSGPVEKISLEVNPGLYKNAMSAGIPGCTQVGITWAVAIGAALADPRKGLQLLEDVTPAVLARAEKLVEGGAVQVTVKQEERSIYACCTLKAGAEEAVCTVQNAHTNVVHLRCGDRILIQKEAAAPGASDDPLVDALTALTVSGIGALVESCTEEELAFLEDGIAMNEALSDYSREHPMGVGLSQSLEAPLTARLLGGDLLQKIVQRVTSAAENRLDGCTLPTMSSSGAGTKGLVVILPVSETAKAIGASRLQMLRALALAHLLNRYCNAFVGKLSPMCSCVMCSSTAASAGIAYLLGGTAEQIGHAIRNMAGTVTGMICDGGKVGCAMKVATGSFAALMSAIHAVNGSVLRVTDGICAETPEQCIRNMANVGNRGMRDTDREILRIMTQDK